jgi:hypothetical protein
LKGKRREWIKETGIVGIACTGTFINRPGRGSRSNGLDFRQVTPRYAPYFGIVLCSGRPDYGQGLL